MELCECCEISLTLSPKKLDNEWDCETCLFAATMAMSSRIFMAVIVVVTAIFG